MQNKCVEPEQIKEYGQKSEDVIRKQGLCAKLTAGDYIANTSFELLTNRKIKSKLLVVATS